MEISLKWIEHPERLGLAPMKVVTKYWDDQNDLLKRLVLGQVSFDDFRQIGIDLDKKLGLSTYVEEFTWEEFAKKAKSTLRYDWLYHEGEHLVAYFALSKLLKFGVTGVKMQAIHMHNDGKYSMMPVARPSSDIDGINKSLTVLRLALSLAVKSSSGDDQQLETLLGAVGDGQFRQVVDFMIRRSLAGEVGLGLEGQILVDMRGTPMGYLENGLQMKKDEILRPLGDLGDQVPKDISRTEALWIITLLVEDRLRQMGVDERKVKEYGTHFLRKVWTRGEITADEIHVEAVARFGNRYGWSGFFRRVLLGIHWIKMVEYGEEWDRKRSLNLIKGGRAKLLVRFGDRF